MALLKRNEEIKMKATLIIVVAYVVVMLAGGAVMINDIIINKGIL